MQRAPARPQRTGDFSQPDRGKWLLKNSFLPVQMILENWTFFTPGLLCGCSDSDTVPLTLTSLTPVPLVHTVPSLLALKAQPYPGRKECEEQVSFQGSLWGSELMARAPASHCASISRLLYLVLFPWFRMGRLSLFSQKIESNHSPNHNWCNHLILLRVETHRRS